MITKAEVEKIAAQAYLELTAQEKDLYAGQLNNILDYARVLDELDTGDVPPTIYVPEARNVLREDEVGEHLDHEQVLLNAPDREDDFFRVPKIV